LVEEFYAEDIQQQVNELSHVQEIQQGLMQNVKAVT